MAETVNLVVRVPETMRRQARAAAALRGETLADVVRQALAEYVAQAKESGDTAAAD